MTSAHDRVFRLEPDLLTVHEDDLTDQQWRDLIAFHPNNMGTTVLPGALFLDFSALRQPSVTVWRV